MAEFYNGNGADGKHYWCIECFKLRNKNNYEKRKDEIIKKQAIRRVENKEYFKKYRKANRHKANAIDAKRRASKLKATPAWANKFYIEEIYRLAKDRTKLHGFVWHVDHIVPLINKNVCGLHCEHNLQVIPAHENLKKGNRFIENTEGNTNV